MSDRCPVTGCGDDVCHGTQECMRTGYPLGQRCTVCNEVVVDEYGEACACERSEAEWEGRYLDCACPYCHCMNTTEHGGACGECLAGVHQG